MADRCIRLIGFFVFTLTLPKNRPTGKSSPFGLFQKDAKAFSYWAFSIPTTPSGNLQLITMFSIFLNQVPLAKIKTLENNEPIWKCCIFGCLDLSLVNQGDANFENAAIGNTLEQFPEVEYWNLITIEANDKSLQGGRKLMSDFTFILNRQRIYLQNSWSNIITDSRNRTNLYSVGSRIGARLWRGSSRDIEEVRNRRTNPGRTYCQSSGHCPYRDVKAACCMSR
ncbi:uncharacterized protein BDR25DRAFT_394416 [Lindgomyces ingoldianus]|uniref:Uncharacterized protein n=1 Tax=Lindgomyces ingoldianus TaxID=673940 RepID=A0ACB6QSG0_9PLEO|nr:uncharacterized protein BDR25DRAFT_394416 [Lindgomyces ingoldianus]KAF2469465.1 hypothetical protein BDR25DRAFT_394416 [Lindgomyces ingoldianus]